MSGYRVYCDYIALKQHFSKESFDYFKYGGKSRVKHETYEKRKDKIFFEKIGRKQDYHNYLVANISHDPKVWIRDLCADQCEKRYSDWNRTIQSISYIFKSDLSNLIPKLEDNFTIDKNNQHPYLIRLYLGNKISLESFCIIVYITGVINIWDNKLEYDPIWEELRLKVIKYTPFIKFDKKKFKKIFIDYFQINKNSGTAELTYELPDTAII